MSIAPTSVWVIIQKDREGNPRGMEKTTGNFYLDEASAVFDLCRIDPIKLPESYMVAEVVVMGRPEFDRDYNPITA